MIHNVPDVYKKPDRNTNLIAYEGSFRLSGRHGDVAHKLGILGFGIRVLMNFSVEVSNYASVSFH